jgi:hypothetical protein
MSQIAATLTLLQGLTCQKTVHRGQRFAKDLSSSRSQNPTKLLATPWLRRGQQKNNFRSCGCSRDANNMTTLPTAIFSTLVSQRSLSSHILFSGRFLLFIMLTIDNRLFLHWLPMLLQCSASYGYGRFSQLLRIPI